MNNGLHIESYEEWLKRKYPKQKPLFIFRCQTCYGTGEINGEYCRACDGWGERPLFNQGDIASNLYFKYVKEVRLDGERFKKWRMYER